MLLFSDWAVYLHAVISVSSHLARIKVISKFYFDQPVFTKCGLESNYIAFSTADRVRDHKSVPAKVSHHECNWVYDLTQ